MSDNGVARVHFYPKQYLGPQDFEDEQHYHLTRLRQHQIGHHSWGIVRGLELALNSDETGLVIRPGVAVDGYGRLLVLEYEYALVNDEFDYRGANELDVWLVYALQESGQERNGSLGCIPAKDLAGNGRNGSKEPFNRWQEQPVVRLTVPNTANPVEPRRPEAVPQGNWDFAPTRTPPDSPLDDWPVYLGRATRTQDKPPRGPYTYNPNLSGRPYAGLVGEIIRHPTGRAWVQIGAPQPAGGAPQPADEDPIRFAVFVRDSQAGSPDDRLSLAGCQAGTMFTDASQTEEPNEEEARFEIAEDGRMTLRGKTTVEGDVVVSRGGVTFGAGKPYNGSQPWRFYRVAGQMDQDGNLLPEQWRLELEPGGEFSIGYFSAQEKKYKDCFRVRRPASNDPTESWAVSIDGDLNVTGLIRERVLVPPELGVQAQALVMQSFMAPLFGQVVTPHQLALEGQPGVDLAEAGISEQINLLSRRIFVTNPALAKNLALALVNQDTQLNLAKEVALDLIKQDQSLSLAKEFVLAVTELIRPDDPIVLETVKNALGIL
jgi:hypothetical protein